MQENIANLVVHSQGIALPPAGHPASPSRRQLRNSVEHDGGDEPPAFPPRHMRYAVANGAAVAGMMIPSDDVVPQPPPRPPSRSRRGSNRSSSANGAGANAASSISIQELGEVSAGDSVQPSRVLLPPLQARHGSGAASSPSVVSSVAYNTGPLDQMSPRGNSAVPRNRLDQA
jgi:hypothetical protein